MATNRDLMNADRISNTHVKVIKDTQTIILSKTSKFYSTKL